MNKIHSKTYCTLLRITTIIFLLIMNDYVQWQVGPLLQNLMPKSMLTIYVIPSGLFAVLTLTYALLSRFVLPIISCAYSPSKIMHVVTILASFSFVVVAGTIGFDVMIHLNQNDAAAAATWIFAGIIGGMVFYSILCSILQFENKVV